MRTISCGVAFGWVVLAAFVSACGGDGGNTGTGGTGGANAGGQNLGGAAGSAGGGQPGVSGSGGANPQGGGSAGGNTFVACKVLGEGETGAHGLKLAYQSPNFGASYAPLGIEAGQVYFTAGGKVMSYPVAGGTAQELGASLGSRQLVRSGKLYGFAAGADGKLGSMLSAPLADLTMKTTLAESIAEPQLLVADDAALYFDRREPSSMFKLPLAGGTPEEIVPGASPLGMISHMGNLYWLDFETSYLERVPVAGGARQRLAKAFFGGPMAAAGDRVFWADTSLKTIESWQEGATTSQRLNSTGDPFSSPEDLAVDGDSVYWVLGFGCGEVHRVQLDGSANMLYTQGTSSADWVGLADGALFVIGRGGLYRADR